jgi:hypothetical protein
MNQFVFNINNQEARTANNMKARVSTACPLVDLFFKIGASRGKDIIPDFVAAYVKDNKKALRIALWARDCRGGAGERKLFRSILEWMVKNHPDFIRYHERLMEKIVEVGRYDDLFALLLMENFTEFNSEYLCFKVESEIVVVKDIKERVLSFIAKKLSEKDRLCAKWMPRKGPIAKELANFMKLTPRQYRKLLVSATEVVETKMCSNRWDDINFGHVPSVAANRYQKAFKRHTPKYEYYLENLKNGKDKINASVLYPYDVLKSIKNGNIEASKAQWDSLPNYMGDDNVLAMIDVSGSMHNAVSKELRAIDVALSLGLYIADKSKGAFKDVFLTFSDVSELLQLNGNIIEKISQINGSTWGMNTNIAAAFNNVLVHAVKFSVPKEDMPSVIVILSDMQFDECAHYDDSAIQMISRIYETYGYNIPKIVFWNLLAAKNAPVEFNKNGVALVSGFSPSIMKSVLKAQYFNPEQIMLDTIMSDRYSI